MNFQNKFALENLFYRCCKCPISKETKKLLWVHGKIRVLPTTKLSGRTVFEILSLPVFISYWVCEQAPGAVTESELIAEVRDWEKKGLGVYLVGPCGNAVTEQYCLYSEDEHPDPLPGDTNRYVESVDPLTLNQQLDQQPQKSEPDQQIVEGPA